MGKVALNPALLAPPPLTRRGPRSNYGRRATNVPNSLISATPKGGLFPVSHGLSHGRPRHLLRRGRHHSRHRHRVLLHPSNNRRGCHIPVRIEIRNWATHTNHHLEGWW